MVKLECVLDSREERIFIRQTLAKVIENVDLMYNVK